jgi:transposase
MHANVIGLDVAKNVFQAAVSHHPGKVSKDKRLSRAKLLEFFAQQPRSKVVMEACGSAHYWARELRKLGHRPVLLPARLVRPYVTRHKTDKEDARALLEASRNRRIRPVPVKTPFQQVLASHHRVRQSLIERRTAVLNELRGCVREHGVFIPVGPSRVLAAVRTLLQQEDPQVPAGLYPLLSELCAEVETLELRIEEAMRRVIEISQHDPLFRLYQTIPGIGPLTASALIAFVGDLRRFPSCRHFACYLGVTQRIRSSGEKVREGKISKQGDKYLRYLLVHGARSVISHASKKAPIDRLHHWADRLDKRMRRGKAIVAVANKLARIIWAVHRSEQAYRAQPADYSDSPRDYASQSQASI